MFTLNSSPLGNFSLPKGEEKLVMSKSQSENSEVCEKSQNILQATNGISKWTIIHQGFHQISHKEACVSIRTDKFTAVLLRGNKARNSEKW